MARDRRRRQYNALVASAQVVTAAEWNDRPRGEAWHNEAWRFYDQEGPFRFAITWKANATSRVRLCAARLMPGGDEPEVVTDGLAAELVDKLAGGTGGQASLLKSCSTHLNVPGTGWIVFVPKDEADPEPDLGEATCLFLSDDEIQVQAGVYQQQVASGKWESLPANTVVIQIWREHERYRWKPDSPARAALPVLRELDMLNRHIYASGISRLAGNGIFLYPSDASLPVKEEHKDAPDPFSALLVEAMTTPLADPGNASAVVPLPLGVKKELIEYFKHLTFSTPFDDRVLDLRDAALRRLGITMDMPAEILLGLGDINHWGQWQIEETGLKIHIDPDMELICHAFTTGYLQPGLRAALDPEADQYIVWYDTSELAVRPDKSGNTIEAYDRLEASGEALRRETGLDDGDKPGPAEIERRVLLDTLKALPSYAPVILPLLFPGIQIPAGGSGTPLPDSEPVISPSESPEAPQPAAPPELDNPNPAPPVASLAKLNGR